MDKRDPLMDGRLDCDGKVSIFEGKSVMCFVGTPFQFFALLCIFSSKLNCCYKSLDLYVYPSFRDVYDTCERFCNVVRVRRCFINSNFDDPPRIPILPVIKCLETIVHSRRGRDRFVEAFPQAKAEHYDIVMCSSASDHTLTAKQFYAPDGYTIFYDDGIGSHNGNVFKSNFCLDRVLLEERRFFSKTAWRRNKLKATARIVGRGKVQHKIRALYLFNPSPFESELYPAMDIEAIAVPDDVSIVRQCISPKTNGSAYEGARFVFLSLPGDVPDEALAIETSLIHQLASSLDGFVVRPHPRRNPDDFKCLNVRIVNNFDSWEILLMQGSITERMTLIGFGSSAQVHPKALFNLEPRVVFLHRLLCSIAHPSTSVDLMIDAIRERYRDEDKVLVIDSLEQFEEMLDKHVRRDCM